MHPDSPQPAPSTQGFRFVDVRTSTIEANGVFAGVDFAAGELILTIDDSHPLTPGTSLAPEQDRFCDFLGAGRIVLMQGPECHINHSCDPNVFVQTVRAFRQVRARRHISLGDELTFDYSINGFGDTVWACHCKAQRCRKTIHSDFFHLPLHLQLEYLPLLDTWYRLQFANQVQRLEATIPS